MGIQVVLDTNCVVSALLFSRGSMTWLRACWQNGEITPIVCRETVLELIRVLSYPKFNLSENEQQILLAEFLPYAETLNYCESKMGSVPAVRDLKDQIFLNLAISQQVKALITGDQDLLVLKHEIAIPIVTLAEFRNTFFEV